MSMVHQTKHTYGGRTVFRIGARYFVMNSQHNTRANAELSQAYRDSFYFGKTRKKIVKYGRYYLVLQPVPLELRNGRLVKKSSGLATM